MIMKTASVQIVTYNSEAHISSCLEAVYRQTYCVDEIIIVDNHSTDRTVEILQQLGNEYPHTLIVNETNNGFAAGHNQAMKLSKSDYILVLNPDVILHPDYLRYAVEVMEANSEIGSVTGKLILQNSDNKLDSTGLVIKRNRQVYDRGANEVDYGQWDQQRDVFGVSGAAALYRREMVDDISIDHQFYDKLFFAYKEDVDVAWRSRLYGWQASYEPKAIGFHERGWGEKRDRKAIPLRIRQHSYVNKYYVMIKNDHHLYIILHLPFILTYEILRLSYILVREPKLLASWRQLLKHLPKLLKDRKVIQSNRKVPYKLIYDFFKR